MNEDIVINGIATMSGILVLWRIVIYQGKEITKLTKRLDQLWDKCFSGNVDNDNKKE